MICGHLGVAYGARARHRDVPFAWLLGAAVAPDALDGLYALAHICSPDGLYSHSLPAMAILTVVLSAVAFFQTGRRRAAWLVGLMVVAHILPDYVTGQKLLWDHGPLFGLDLYRWPLLDFAIELPIIVLGWLMLRRAATVPRWMVSGAALAVLLIVQVTINASQVHKQSSHRPPPRACRR